MSGALLTLEQAAARLGRSVGTMRYWRQHGEGPPTFKIGRRVMVDESDLSAWIEAQRRKSDAEGVA